MTAIVGAFGRTPLPDAALARVHAAMGPRGGDQTESWRSATGGAAALGVSRAHWEMDASFAGPVLVLREDELVVAADASLYYLPDLRRALAAAGVRVGGSTPSHFILAAYRAWGERCAERLEGDFAFVLWDGAARRVVAARDFSGKRPLFYAEAGGTLIVASTIGGVLAGSTGPHELNLTAIAADAAGVFGADVETCYQGVLRLPAAHTLTHALTHALTHTGGGVRVTRHWSPPPVGGGRAPFDEAAQELRELLRRATAERLAPGPATSLWLSGGWDSTAVLASGEHLLATRAAGEHLRAVSVSYPPGDPGREDELIAAAAAQWGSPVHWIDAGTIPLLDAPAARAAARDEPLGHGFESTSRALARGSRAVGTRVAFDGNGGDQLFQLSPVYLADLLRAGRWPTLAREWRARGLRGRRTFFQYAVQPLLPPLALDVAARLRGGRRLPGYLDRVLPAWVRPDFARRHQLLERDRAAAPPSGGLGPADYEAHWQLVHAFFPRVFAMVGGFALEEGVELRSPLFDRRVVEFAVTRPRVERAQGRETKRLLRRAMRGWLPDALLAPRTHRTGMPTAYLAGSLRNVHALEIDRLLAAPMALDAVGVVDARTLRQAWSRYRRGDDRVPGLSLLMTLHVELWLRARLEPAAGASPMPATTTA